MMSSVRIELLSKDNYDTWALQVEALLVKAELWEYVNGGYQKPNNDPELEKWKLADQKAKADLILSINPSELKQIRGCETSHDVWVKLQSIYASRGPARKATLLKQLIMHKLEEGRDVKEHMAKFFDSVDKLENMDVKIDGDLLSIMLLYSLPASYENFRCAIESRDNLPKTEALKIKILEESEQSSGNAVIAMTADPRKPNQNMKKGFIQKKFKCFKCGLIGHKANECRSKGKYLKKNNNFNQDPLENFYAATVGENNAINTNCILDSGCTTHLCKDKNAFTNLNTTSKTKIKLASQACAEVEGQGIVQLTVKDQHLVQSCRTFRRSLNQLSRLN